MNQSIKEFSTNASQLLKVNVLSYLCILKIDYQSQGTFQDSIQCPQRCFQLELEIVEILKGLLHLGSCDGRKAG